MSEPLPKPSLPLASPIEPIALETDSRFQFDCHPGVACFNACCRSIDITLTPHDIQRLKQRLKMTSGEFVAQHTVPFEMDHHGLPGLKMITKPGSTECVFLKPSGCSVYGDRPAACRYYALGNMGVKPQHESRTKEVYFLVKESHCKGHEEPRTRSVAQYLCDQGLNEYEDANREWRDIVLKKRSAGATIGKPSKRSMQLFDMCSYDFDNFRKFIQSPGFQQMFSIDSEQMQSVLGDETALFHFSMRFLRQVLFGEQSIPMNDQGRQQRIERRKNVWEQRHEAEIKRYREDQAEQTDSP